MKKIVASLQWPQALVAVALIAGGVCAAIFAPEDVRGALVGVLMAVASWLKVQP